MMQIHLIEKDQASPLVRRRYDALAQQSGSVSNFNKMLTYKPDVLRSINQFAYPHATPRPSARWTDAGGSLTVPRTERAVLGDQAGRLEGRQSVPAFRCMPLTLTERVAIPDLRKSSPTAPPEPSRAPELRHPVSPVGARGSMWR